MELVKKYLSLRKEWHVDFSMSLKIKKMALTSSLLAILWMPSIAWGEAVKGEMDLTGSKIQASCKSPRQGPQGIQGPIGPTGPTGTTLDSLFVNNSTGFAYSGPPLSVPLPIPFDFPGADITTGSSITQLNSTTFTINSPGVYYAVFMGNMAPVVASAFVQFQLNGTLIGVPVVMVITSPAASLSYSLQQAFVVTPTSTPATLNVVLTTGSTSVVFLFASIEILRLGN